MSVLVMGGGVIGVTTAYFLAKDGHDVTVVEQATSLADWASGANAGLFAPGQSFAWASPAAPGQLVRSLAGAETAIRVDPKVFTDPKMLTWGIKFLRECTSSRAERNTLVKLRLAQYSQQVHDDLHADMQFTRYEPGPDGLFYLYLDREEFAAGVDKMALLQRHGQAQEVLDADECVAREPAFASFRDHIAGAVYGVDDHSGDSRAFVADLADRCEDLGVKFRLDTRITSIDADDERVRGVATDREILRADTYIMALGPASPLLSATFGQRLPIYPAKGYAATFPIRDHHEPPTHSGINGAMLVAWSNFGDRLRVSSTAEFAGYDSSWEPGDFNNILGTVREMFPNGADYDDGRYRATFRPMTPDGPPIIGFGRHANLLYNTGHGHMGWTMAPGSGKVAADLVAGRKPELSLTGMQVRR